MAEKNTGLLLLVCALTSAIVFFGCGGGNTSSDPIPIRTYLISGKITSNQTLQSIQSTDSGIRGSVGVSNAEVYVEEDRSSYSTTTDENGNFSLTVPEGSYHLIARIKTNTGNTYKVRSTQVSVSRGNPHAELSSIVLQPAKSAVNGMVKDALGKPIANAKIMVWGEEVYSDVAGKFTTPPMPDGITAPIKFVTSGYQEAELEVKFDEDAPMYVEQTIVGQGSTNRPPVVALSATSYKLTALQSTSLSAIAQDPDRDTLTYIWSSTHGSLATRSSGLSAVWTAPETPTIATVSVMVKDTKGLSASAFVAITVGAASQQPSDQNHPPVVTDIQTATTTFMNNAHYELTAVATDSDGDVLTYTWSAAKGTVNPTDQPTTIWTTPDVSGTDYVRVTVLVSDGKGGSGSRTATFTVSTDPNPPENKAPTASIISPVDGALFAPGTIIYNGAGTDPEDGELSASSFSWYQNKHGGTKTLIGNQTKSFSIQIYDPGTYVVELEVSDRLGSIDSTTASFRINSNPFAHITAPSDGDIFQLGESITFTGIGTDVEDISINSASLSWKFSSSSYATGTPQVFSEFPAGTNTIELYAYDSLGAKSLKDSVSIFINSNPEIISVSPSSGSVYLSGESITFTVAATDPDETIAPSSIVWKRGPTVIGTGFSIDTDSLPVGLQIITVEVSDQMKGSITSSTSVVINQRPEMSIDAPVNNAVAFVDQEITFKGSGSSAFGPVASSTMIWQDIYKNATSTFSDATGKDTFTYTFDNSKPGKHIIVLTGSDEYAASSYTQNILWVNATPSVSINSPASATRFDLHETIAFSASPSDPDPTDSFSVTWFDGDTAIGNGNSLSYSNLASGNHNIFCTVTDQHGISNTASISVFVNTLPTGTINISTPQYATAPGDIPVYMSTSNELEINFSIDTFDTEIGGTIESYKPENLRWYTNTGSGYVFNGDGNSLTHSLPLGSSTIKVEIYDSFYGSHPNATETMSVAYKSLYIWQSVDFNYGIYPMPDNPVFIHGSGLTINPDLYFTNGEPIVYIRQVSFDGNRPNGFLEQKDDYNPTASYTFTLGICAVPFEQNPTLLGFESGVQTMLSFSEPDTWLGLFSPAQGFNEATSIAFNSAMASAKTAYAANKGQVIAFDSEFGSAIGERTSANNKAFGDLLRIRFTTAFGSDRNLFVADYIENRIVILSPSLANPGLIDADAPADMAFTKNMLMSLNGATNEISLIEPGTNTLLMKFGGSGTTPGKFSNARSIYSTGYDLFVLEDGKMQVIRSGYANWLKP